METSFLDWRGCISAVLFLPGCNFRCPFCHNFTLVEDPDSLATLPLKGLMDRLRPFAGWIDGVVVSGGEPTLHPGLEGLLTAFKDAGFMTKLDTNGSRPQVLEHLAQRGLLDKVSMDLKAPLEPQAYARVCGRPVEIQTLRRSIAFLKQSGLAHEFRSTVVPQWHGPEELQAMAQELAGGQRWTLQAMNPGAGWNQEVMKGLIPYSAAELARLQSQWADKVG